MRLTKLGRKELKLQRHKSKDHEDDLCDEVNSLFTVVLDAKLGPQHSLLHVELFDLHQQLLVLIEVLARIYTLVSSYATILGQFRIGVSAEAERR